MRAVVDSGGLTCLKTLDLSSNPIMNVGVTAVARALARGAFHCLGALDLSRCGMDVDGMRELALALSANACPGLHTLDVSYQDVGDRGMTYLAEAIRATSSLTGLSCSRMGMALEGATALFEALDQSLPSELKKLNVSYNRTYTR